MSTAAGEYLTTLQATEALGISKSTLYRLRRSGLLRGYHLGRRVYVKRQELFDLITASPVASEEPA
jgi:excisionase family DNA binding protein